MSESGQKLLHQRKCTGRQTPELLIVMALIGMLLGMYGGVVESLSQGVIDDSKLFTACCCLTVIILVLLPLLFFALFCASVIAFLIVYDLVDLIGGWLKKKRPAAEHAPLHQTAAGNAERSQSDRTE
ncbi:MAG: hypothetical protein FWH27_06515 [Planctomycetaceae bacterium]|nr:hypothetical protein [Planctomycetaceae bacterium]